MSSAGRYHKFADNRQSSVDSGSRAGQSEVVGVSVVKQHHYDQARQSS